VQQENDQDKEIAAGIEPILVKHFHAAGLPGIGCYITLVIWLAVAACSIVAWAKTGEWQAGIAIPVVVGFLLYPVARWFEKIRTDEGNQVADEELSELCRKYDINRQELFRIAIEAMQMENLGFLALIDPEFAEKKLAADLIK